MDQNVNPWKANITNGMIFALIGIVYTLLMYFFDLTLNKVQGWVFMLVQIVILYFLLKSYRDNYRYGSISYSQGLGAGMIIFLYYAIIIAIFSYILYAWIDPDLIDKQLAFAEEQMLEKGIPAEAVEAGMKVQAKLLKPSIMAFLSIIGTMVQGLIMSLIVAAFVRKENNPLIDNPIN
ncbi:MAG: DUF4199 domain-containing protein [Bacteroidales bacterium]|nr:DUF4199 domain-containing protein [Bacteroidales bacterium]